MNMTRISRRRLLAMTAALGLVSAFRLPTATAHGEAEAIRRSVSGLPEGLAVSDLPTMAFDVIVPADAPVRVTGRIQGSSVC